MPSLSESQRQPRQLGSDMPSPPATRSQSVASDCTSAFKAPLLPSPQMSRRPEPAYIAASAASQIVTNDQDPMSLDLLDEHDMPTSGEPALVTQASLKLVNCFLDQLLYDFLSVARSTSLASLRPAVTEILRPTLAGEAIAGADEELHEYLGRGVEEDQLGYHDDPGPAGSWDLDAVWRQARLRCMIYSSLGDMEGEEEEMFLAEEQHPGATDGSGYFPGGQDLVSPAVAIFLTSILESIGEQILLLAGQAAAQRVISRRRDATVHNGSSTSIVDGAERLIVDELDTEKVALNPTFGRLWRAWRKRLRTSVASYPRSISRDSNVSRRRQHSIASSSRRSSIDTIEPRSGLRERSRTKNLRGVPEEDFAANIALPMSENDIEEIEVPGVADLDDYARAVAESESVEGKRRHRSLTIPPAMSGEHSFPDPCRTHAPILPQLRTSKLLYLSRNRSQSLPSLTRAPFGVNSEVPNDESTSSHHLQNSKVATEGQQDPDLEIQVKVKLSGTADGNCIHKEGSEGEGQAPRRIPSELHNESLPVEHENQQVGISKFATNVDGTAADARTVSSGSSLGLITKHQADGLHDAVDFGAIDEDYNQPRMLGMRSNEAETYGASDLLYGHSEKPFDTRSVSPLDPSDMDDGLIPADGDVSPQSDDRELGTDHTSIGIARTSNVPVFVTKSDYWTSPSSGPQSFDWQQAENVTWSKGFDDGTYGVESSLYDPKETRGSVQQRPNYQAHESPVLPHTPTFQLDPAVASKRTSPLDLQQSVIAPGPRAFTTENNPSPNSHDNLASGSINSQPANSELTSSSRTAKQLSVGSRRSEQRFEYASAASSTSPGRASVQRLFNPPSPAREVTATRTKRSDSYGRGQGPVHKSTSGAPQGSPKLKNLVPRLHDEGDVQERVGHHADEIGSGATGRKHSPTAVKSSSKEKSFEQLMRSDKTIQYTLTPPNVREMEETLRRTDTAGPARSPRKTGPTFTTQPPLFDVTPPTFTPSDGKGVKPALSVSRPFRPPSKPRPGVPIARDGRAEWSSTRDFAEFIRTTGPDRYSESIPGSVPSHSDSVPSKPSRSRPVGGPLRPIRSRSKKTSAAVQPSITEPKSDPSRSSAISKPKVRLQARDAVVSQKDDSSALVDFIRQGPPNQRDEQESAIAQVIAPFNSPPDPNSSFSRGRVHDVTSTHSAYSTLVGSSRSQAQSVHSSYGSRTALLDSNPAMSETTRSENAPPIQRKQRHVRDPYAIDTDNEEEEEEVASKSRAKPGREESLMDFLRNVPPPPAQTTLTSAFDDVPKPGPKTLSKRDTSNASKSRFGRGEPSKISSSKTTIKKTAPKEEKLPSSSSSIVSSQPPQLSLPPHSHDSPFDTTDALRAAARSVVGSSSSAIGNTDHRSPALGSSQPLSGRSEAGRPTDLAMFLKTTEPPATAARHPPAGKEESGFSKMFRKIKSNG